jgi:hypothetical protein
MIMAIVNVAVFLVTLALGYWVGYSNGAKELIGMLGDAIDELRRSANTFEKYVKSVDKEIADGTD